MTTRVPATLLAGLLVFGAACTPADDTVAEDTTTSPTSATPPPTTELVYSYPLDETITYAVTVSQDITFDATGDAPGFGDATLPIDADLVTESTGTAAYAVSGGTTDGTVTIGITARFPETRVAGTVNGTTVDNLEEGGVEADLARIDPVDVTLTVDRLGTIVEEAGAAPVLGADMAALTGITNDLFSQPVGPTLPDGPATVGTNWETATTRVADPGVGTVRSASRIVDFVDGMFVIETTTMADGFEVDFSTEFRNLYRDIAESEAEGDLPPEIVEQLDTIEFVITVDESTTTETSTFDPERGLVAASRKSTTMRLRMSFRAPDDAGAVSGFDIVLDISQTAVFTLVE